MKYILYVGIVFLTFSIIPVSDNRAIGPSLFIISYLFFRYFRRLDFRFIWDAFFCLVLAIIQVSFFFYYELSFLSVFQFALFCFFIVFAINFDISDEIKANLLSDVVLACYYSFYSLFFLAVIQFLEFYMTGSYHIIGLLSELQMYSNSYIIKQIQQGYFRATASYFEPSFFAFVVLSLWTVLCCSGKSRKIEDLSLVLIMLISSSLSGMLTACVLLFFKYIGYKNFISSFSKLFLFMIGAFFLIYFGDLLFYRLEELNVEGSSGYYRMVAPFFLIDWVLSERIIPIPIGSIDEYMGNIGVMNGEEVGTSIDNGYYVVLANFSWIGVVFIFYFLFNMIAGFYRCFLANDYNFLAYLFLLIAPLYTGAIFSSEFLFVIILVILSVRLQPKPRF